VKKIRLLSVIFDTEIKSFEIPAFRSAIIGKTGNDNLLFHNHLNGKAFLYKYPLIQYKQIGKHPALICIEQGVDEIHKYFENKNWDISLSGRTLSMKISYLNMNQFNMQVWESTFQYSIRSWIALSQENYPRYKALGTETERIEMLQRTLTANIISFAKGIEWDIDRKIELKITSAPVARPVTLKGHKVIGFDLDFRTNVFLPNHIGLGKSVSLGFGNVKQLKN
jgi:hypothetical protein